MVHPNNSYRVQFSFQDGQKNKYKDADDEEMFLSVQSKYL